jgi:hypothetical protein
MAKSNKPQSQKIDNHRLNQRHEAELDMVANQLLGSTPRYVSVFADRFCRRNLTVRELIDMEGFLKSLLEGKLVQAMSFLDSSSSTVSQAPQQAAEAMRVIDSLKEEREKSR